MKGKVTIRKVLKNGKIEQDTKEKDYVPIGKIVNKLQEHTIRPKNIGELGEQSKSMTVDYIDNLELAVKNGKKVFDGDFFISVLTKHERILRNVFRNYYHPRVTYPIPNYDSALYKYDHKKEDLIFLWVIPDQQTCNLLYMNKSKVYGRDLELLPYVVNFINGKYHKEETDYNSKIESVL